MRFLLSASLLLLAACGATQFTTHDPYADAGQVGSDAGVDAGTTGGGGGAVGGGGGGGGGGGATGGGGGATGGGGGGGATGGGGGGGATGGGGGGGATGGGGGGGATGGGGGGTCSPANCQGCCESGTCHPGTTPAQCGKSGTACVACPATDVCKADQSCGIDPASTWQILPTSATIAPDNNGVPWDSLSDPDAEIGLWCPSSEVNVSAVMPKVTDNFNPTWSSGGCTATSGGLLADGLGFAALERDTLSDDVIVGFTVAPITEADLRAGTKTVGPNGGLESMTLLFTKQ